MKRKYCCKHCARILFEGDFMGRIEIVCRKCKTVNIYVN